MNESPVKSGYFPFLEGVGHELVIKSPTNARAKLKLGVVGHELELPTHDRL